MCCLVSYDKLTTEQQAFIQQALNGYNILVEACVGSGKTTAIQTLCNFYPPEKHILYLTYNKLLKLDAQSRILRPNVKVTNYHGFAYGELVMHGIRPGVSDTIVRYNKAKLPASGWDVLILDEYQDIEHDIAEMLMYLKEQNPNMQIIAVGDICQKIYDKTTLDASSFIYDLLGKNMLPMEFTQCFRLSSSLAQNLSMVWEKKIVGVNPDCEVETMNFREALSYMQTCRPEQLLVLGSNNGVRNDMLNELEAACPDVFNKNTVWSKVMENDGGASQPRPDCAIFTTYDGCKGMERDVCVVLDWTVEYWYARINKPGVQYEILRNIFCVAASRGRKKIIFVKSKGRFLDWATLMEYEPTIMKYEDQDMSTMFDFKYIEDVEEAWSCLECKTIQSAGAEIAVPTTDGLIDLSPCLGLYQELAYFKDSRIDRYIDTWFSLHKNCDHLRKDMTGWRLDQKILYFTMLQTGQNRYFNQVRIPFVSDMQWQQIEARLSQVLPADSTSQVRCEIPFYRGKVLYFTAKGFLDVLKDKTVYELKFVSGLSHTHMLQCALYIVARYLQRGILWNVKTNEMIEIRVPDRNKFLSLVAKAVTKGSMVRYDRPKKDMMSDFISKYETESAMAWSEYQADRLKLVKMPEFFENLGLCLPGTGRDFTSRMEGIMKILEKAHRGD